MKNSSKIPRAARKLPHARLAEGEATGHFHLATGKGVALYERETSLWLDAPGGSVVTHQEHAPVPLPPGQYERRIVQEFDHLREQARKVID